MDRPGRSPARCPVTLALRGFSRESVESEAVRFRVSPAEFVEAAVDRHVTRQAGRRSSRGLPPLVLEPASGEPLELELELSPDTVDVLELQAAVEGISLAALMEHASLTLVAEMDSGAEAPRIASEFD